MKVTDRLDAVIKEALTMNVEIRELFLSEQDYSEVQLEAKKNMKSLDLEVADEIGTLVYRSAIGVIKLSRV